FVMLGGSALMILSAIRGIALWVTVGREKKAPSAHAHDHHHDHEHEHGHEHAHGHHHHHHHDHAHDHSHRHDHAHVTTDNYDEGHDHGWAPWRYAVLVLPVVLFLLDLPPRAPGYAPTEDAEHVPYLPYKQVEEAAKDPGTRAKWTHMKTHLRGWFSARGA